MLNNDELLFRCENGCHFGLYFDVTIEVGKGQMGFACLTVVEDKEFHAEVL